MAFLLDFGRPVMAQMLYCIYSKQTEQEMIEDFLMIVLCATVLPFIAYLLIVG